MRESVNFPFLLVFLLSLLGVLTKGQQNGTATFAHPEIKIANLVFVENATGTSKDMVGLETMPGQGTRTLQLLPKVVKNITIECWSSFAPVTWSYTGFTAPLQVNLTAVRVHRNGVDKFLASMLIFRVSSQLTGKWTCSFVKDSKMENSIYIFAEEHSYRGEDAFFLNYGKTLEVFGIQGGSVTFPCTSYKKNVEAKLGKRVERRGQEIYEPVDPTLYKYDPTEGFKFLRIEENSWGKYICFTDMMKTYDRVKIILSEKLDFTVSPANTVLELLTNETLDLKCSTKDSRFQVTIVPSDPRLQGSIVVSANSQEAVLKWSDFSYNDDGAFVACHLINDATGNIVKTHKWEYEVISPKDKVRRGWAYYYSRRKKEHTWACWSKSSNVPSVSFVQCTNPMECQVRSACMSLGSRCDGVDAALCSGGCLKLAFQGAGKLRCIGDGVNTTTGLLNLFSGVSGKIYNNTKKLETDELVASINSGNQSFAGTRLLLECKGVSFKFARGFYWEIGLQSGDVFRLDNETRVKPGIAELQEYEEDFDWRVGIIRVSSEITVFSTRITEISCTAPHWDSRNVSNFPLKISIKAPNPPAFSSKAEEDSEIDLSLSERNFRLRCDVTGVPKPTVTWMKDGKEVPRNIVLEDEGYTLLFEEATYLVRGEYTCIAKNPGGTNRKTFTVSVSDSKSTNIILAVTIPGVILVAILILILALFWRRIQRQKEMLRNLTDAEIEEFLYGNPDAIDRSGDTNAQGHLLAYNRDYEFPQEFLDIRLEEKLGAGAYGLVLRGVAKGLFPDEEETVVAIKTLQPNADITNFKAILIELKIMSYIGRHAHIVNLLGACTTGIRKREIYIIVEFCSNGSLDKYLKTHRSDFPTFHSNVRYSLEPQRATAYYENQPGANTNRINLITLLKWARDVASGMEYLSNKKVIHGDLAARNVLITDQLFAKIGDFGLSRQLYEYTNYVKKQQAPLPWRWMAIESLCDMEFSHKSDVWSYGITVWEIFSLGEIPYPGTSWTEDFVRKLRQGNRPPKPDLADDSVYNILIECWQYVSADRPTFTELKAYFENILNQRGIDIMTAPSPPIRKKFNLDITNQNYGIQREVEKEDV